MAAEYPAGSVTESPYRVSVDGRPIAIYQAHTWEPGYVPSYGGPYWFCSFDLSGSAKVEVETSRPLDKLVILPESYMVTSKISDNKVIVNVNRPMQLVLEPDGKNGPLMIFANPQEQLPPDKNDPNVKYFGPGVHRADTIELGSNQTLYLAAGAVVQGGIHAHGDNITIRGRGILDGYVYPRFKGPTRYPVLLENCRNVTVEGIVIKDGWSWTFVPRGCDGIRVENVKLLCARVENGDGFDPVNSRNVTLVNSFIRSDDDCISPKGMGADWQNFYRAKDAGKLPGAPMDNLIVEHCILWTDRAHVWRIGAECVTPVMRNFIFRDIDVLHFPDLWTPDEVPFCISMEPSDDLTQENIVFENIRIRTAGQRGLIDVRPKVTQWARRPVPGRIRNVLFRNVSFSGPAGLVPGRIRISGPSPEFSVSHVRFENLTRNGEPVFGKSPGVELQGFVHDISFKASAPAGIAKTGRAHNGKGVTFNTAPKHPPVVLIEARQPRGVIAAQGGENGPYQEAIARLQTGLKRAVGTELPVVEASDNPWLAIFVGDSPQAREAGLTPDRTEPGGFEVLTLRNQVLIVGNGDGLKQGIDAFLDHALQFIPRGTVEMGTDLVVAPVSMRGVPGKLGLVDGPAPITDSCTCCPNGIHQRVDSFPPFIWKSVPPAGCPFPPSEDIAGILFTGKVSDYRFADTWYPSWAADGNLYSPWTDGPVNGEHCDSNGYGSASSVLGGLLEPQPGKAHTGQAVMMGDDPLKLTVKSLGTVAADPYPYGGRYPCGSLVYQGVWYYGTYCLAPFGITRFGETNYNWPWLGPLVGFRISHDLGKTWTETPHTPAKPLFGETGLWGYPVKIGAPHFVDFGRDMEHSPDGLAYLLAQGAELTDPQPRFANLSWITADQVYLLRVKPFPQTINDLQAYEFFAGHDSQGHPQWTKDFKTIKPLLEWNNHMGCVTATYIAPLKKFLLCVTDGGNTCTRMNTYLLESARITGPWKLVAYLKDFGEQAYFVNVPSKFISADGRTAWLCYSANFALNWNGEKIQSNPPGSHYGLVLQEIKLLEPRDGAVFGLESCARTAQGMKSQSVTP